MGLEKIAYFKKQKDITSEELANKSGVPLSTIKKISAGITKNPSLDTVAAIAKALECSLDDFCDNSTVEKQSVEPSDQTIAKYHLLNADGKSKVDAYIDDLLENDKNKNTAKSISNVITQLDEFAMEQSKKHLENIMTHAHAEQIKTTKEH